MSKATAIKSAASFNANSFQFLAIAGLVVLADWLFYARPLGISVAIFLTAVFAIAADTNRKTATLRELLSALALFAAGVAPLIYSFNLFSLFFAVAGTLLGVQMSAYPRASWNDRIRNASNLVPDMLWRAVADLHKVWHLRAQAADDAFLKSIVAWVVPLTLGTTYVWLFVSANPIIDDWFTAVDWKKFFELLSAPRVVFWLVILFAIWPLVFLRNREVRAPKLSKSEAGSTWESSELFGKTAILRSLILFNVLFAVQTALDATYLWGGMQLPQGMNYSTYAHRGAYPLIVTALLAAAFVLIATRSGSEAERSSLIRNLVYLWTGQNVLLVISSIQRLSLYVDAYSLTYWRVTAFVWMLLVAIGLALIIARLVLRRSSDWLISSNIISLCAVLYICSFINFPLFVANYNVTHSREISGKGVSLDVHYLLSLGPQVIPALDRYVRSRPEVPAFVNLGISDLSFKHRTAMEDWRAWSYQDWELARYLRNRSTAPVSN